MWSMAAYVTRTHPWDAGLVGTLLNGMDPWLGEESIRRLQRKGVEVWLGNPATEVRRAPSPPQF